MKDKVSTIKPQKTFAKVFKRKADLSVMESAKCMKKDKTVVPEEPPLDQ